MLRALDPLLQNQQEHYSPPKDQLAEHSPSQTKYKAPQDLGQPTFHLQTIDDAEPNSECDHEPQQLASPHAKQLIRPQKSYKPILSKTYVH